jgi:hypothetical protein
MIEHDDRGREASQGAQPGAEKPRRDDHRPTLTAEVRRRRTDEQFFLRLRDAIQQNHKALERLGT